MLNPQNMFTFVQDQKLTVLCEGKSGKLRENCSTSRQYHYKVYRKGWNLQQIQSNKNVFEPHGPL